jgi:hypothetical protein
MGLNEGGCAALLFLADTSLGVEDLRGLLYRTTPSSGELAVA